MRKVSVVLGVVLVLGLAVPAVASEGAQVKHRTGVCGVGWSAEDVRDDECEILNVSRPGGGYSLILIGQVPDSELADFQASGVRTYQTSCFAAYLFVVEDGHTPVFVDSVRHFTPDGKMTETCNYLP